MWAFRFFFFQIAPGRAVDSKLKLRITTFYDRLITRKDIWNENNFFISILPTQILFVFIRFGNHLCEWWRRCWFWQLDRDVVPKLHLRWEIIVGKGKPSSVFFDLSYRERIGF